MTYDRLGLLPPDWGDQYEVFRRDMFIDGQHIGFDRIYSGDNRGEAIKRAKNEYDRCKNIELENGYSQIILAAGDDEEILHTI